LFNDSRTIFNLSKGFFSAGSSGAGSGGGGGSLTSSGSIGTLVRALAFPNNSITCRTGGGGLVLTSSGSSHYRPLFSIINFALATLLFGRMLAREHILDLFFYVGHDERVLTAFMSKQCIYYAERRVVEEYNKEKTRCGEEAPCRFPEVAVYQLELSQVILMKRWQRLHIGPFIASFFCFCIDGVHLH